MAGTMPHAIFIETDVDGHGLVGAYAAELPGCAVFAGTDDEAAGAMPIRVSRFTTWLKENGEPAPSFVGDNWYEVERAAATAERRAAFTLDDLPPTDDEFATWLRWLELAREELAAALDEADPSTARPPCSTRSSARTSPPSASSTTPPRSSRATRSTGSTPPGTR